jgi:hypothetical protein
LPTGEAVMRCFENARRFRSKTVARLAPAISIEILTENF